MKLRPIAAVLALVALTISFAEGVWASSCTPGMAMDGMPAQSDVDGCMVGMAGHVNAADNPSSDPPTEPHCPFAPLSTAGACVVAASLPATPPVELAPSPEGALLTVFREDTRDLLLASELFHPPRA